MRVPIYGEVSARGAAATAREFCAKCREAKFIRLCIALCRRHTPACPRGAWAVFGHQQQAARRIALREQQQAAAGFEIERFALSAERADHDRACCPECLFGRPESVFAFSRTRDDQAIERQAVLSETYRIRRAFFSEGSIFAGPEDARGPYPVRS